MQRSIFGLDSSDVYDTETCGIYRVSYDEILRTKGCFVFDSCVVEVETGSRRRANIRSRLTTQLRI